MATTITRTPKRDNNKNGNIAGFPPPSWPDVGQQSNAVSCTLARLGLFQFQLGPFDFQFFHFPFVLHLPNPQLLVGLELMLSHFSHGDDAYDEDHHQECSERDDEGVV